MATTTAQPEPPQRPQNPLIDNVAIVFAVGTPLVMMLPPRKMDLRFFALAGTFSLATNHLCKSYTGESLYARFNHRVSSTVGSVFDTGLSDTAKRTQQLLREHREREAAEKAAAKGLPPPTAQKDKNDSSVLKDLWMGGEDEDWKKKRAEEHQKSFEEGKGMSDIILEQIGDVFSGNWGKKSDDKPTEQGSEKPKN